MESPQFVRRMLCSIALLMYATLLPAQQPDIRLSPEPMSSQLPADIQIQSAASIGSRTLVVWGSGALNTDGSFRPILRMQMLEGNQLYGEQRTVHSETARPNGVVNAVPAGNRFVVLWNDRRDTTVVFAMSIDAEGNMIGSESRFFSGFVRSADDIQPGQGR